MKILAAMHSDTSSRLCGKCQKIDITVEKFVISPNQQAVPPQLSGTRSLGTLPGVLKRSYRCPLCKLIIEALAEQPNTDMGRVFASLYGSENLDDVIDRTGFAWRAECHVSWLRDGRLRVKGEDSNTKDVLRTRRIRVTWSEGGYEEYHLVLVHPNTTFGPGPQFLGRLVTSVGEEKTKQYEIQEWLDTCTLRHGERLCQAEHDARFEDLREESYFGVIDIEEMRLAPLPKGEKYAALSYTWGESQNSGYRFKTTIDNVQDLVQKDGIKSIHDKLSLTIQDTISLVRDLGMRYLWIDSLCILQGDEDIWALNASQMDTVYGNAHLTVCAADGDGADAGLVALHEIHKSRSHWTQHSQRIGPGMELIVSYPSETYVARSKWNKRAWTFQERVLSKRCLIFAEGRVYFQCRSTTMTEDIHSGQAQTGWSVELLHGPLQELNKIETEPVGVYKYSVDLYTSRGLSQENDILAAFSGLGRAICSILGGESIHGLPNSHFDWALLWEPDEKYENVAVSYTHLTLPTKRIV